MGYSYRWNELIAEIKLIYDTDTKQILAAFLVMHIWIILKLAPFNAWQALLKVIETSLDGLSTFLGRL
jgi:hypothetical protein